MRTKVALVVLSISLSVLSVGCGSSGNNSSDPSGPLRITTQSPLPSGRVSTAYSTTFSAAGGTPPYTWSASNLPPGLVMSTVGTLAGTPTAPWDGVPITVAVSDTAHHTATGSFAITIVPQLQITTTSLPNGSPGVAYSAMLQATGGFPPYTWSIPQGSLPGGLTLNASTGVISGTPTGAGTFNLSVQVMDGGSPALAVSVNLSVVVGSAPARGAALYVTDQSGFQIAADGSLSMLPSSLEAAITATPISASPTLPLLFDYTNIGSQNNLVIALQSLLVNSDYSVTANTTSTALPYSGNYVYPAPTVDPTGSYLYVPGYIDTNNTYGIFIYTADGSFQPVGNIAIAQNYQNTAFPRLAITPDGSLAFIPVCPPPPNTTGSILSFTRAANGTLTQVATYTLPTNECASGTQVSPDGRYLAAWGYYVNDYQNGLVQVFSIAGDGTLTPVTQPFTVTLDSQGDSVQVSDMTWDASGSHLVLATYEVGITYFGGMAVLDFSGSSLTEGVYPMGFPINVVERTGSFLYGHEIGRGLYFPDVDGFDLENGQLNPLPGSPWTGNSNFLNRTALMVIY